ncbi:MAG: ferritin-like domain-containing protein, partial [Myxococcales bacterium]|nr:ferritin-like domain-containing protein [Myxococcales bacterium]
LLVVSEDESRHAELSWRLVAWGIEVGGDSVKAAARAAFEQAIAAAEAAEPTDELAHHAHGRLSGREAQEERVRGLREVVRPAMQALFA